MEFIPHNFAILAGVIFLFCAIIIEQKKLSMNILLMYIGSIYVVDIFLIPFFTTEWPGFKALFTEWPTLNAIFTQWPTIEKISQNGLPIEKIVVLIICILLVSLLKNFKS